MSLSDRLLREVRLYLLFIAAFLSVLFMQLVAGLLVALVLLHEPRALGISGGVFLLGVLVLAGAPHVTTVALILLSLPGVVPARWILGFAYGFKPTWRKMFLAYAVASIVVSLLATVADLSDISKDRLTWAASVVLIFCTAGYVFTRRVVLAGTGPSPALRVSHKGASVG